MVIELYFGLSLEPQEGERTLFISPPPKEGILAMPPYQEQSMLKSFEVSVTAFQG